VAPSALTVGVVWSARLEPPDPRCARAEQTGDQSPQQQPARLKLGRQVEAVI